MAIIDKRTGKRITAEDITTKYPERTMELLVNMGRAIWETDQMEVSPTDAISILEEERIRLVDEREELEEEKKEVVSWREEVMRERKRLDEVRNSFEEEKKKFEIEVQKFNKKKQSNK